MTLRRARTGDVPEIHALIARYAGPGRMLGKALVTLYESVPEFWVAADRANGRVVGCGALHVLWQDLAEVRTVVVDPAAQGNGVGHRVVARLLDTAREIGVLRVFVLTFETAFFAEHGFAELRGTPVAPEVYAELLRSYDEGIAEFLGLDHVKPNTLGNTRMLLYLDPDGHHGTRCSQQP